jgi:hypothetical protein
MLSHFPWAHKDVGGTGLHSGQIWNHKSIRPSTEPLIVWRARHWSASLPD